MVKMITLTSNDGRVFQIPSYIAEKYEMKSYNETNLSSGIMLDYSPLSMDDPRLVKYSEEQLVKMARSWAIKKALDGLTEEPCMIIASSPVLECIVNLADKYYPDWFTEQSGKSK